MRIQYASDLHLELWKKTTFDETIISTAPILILVGDIAPLHCPNLQPFLEYVSERWLQIFWIPGNLEIWYNKEPIDSALYKMNMICSPYRNIKVLYKKSIVLEDKENNETLLLIGLSLWHKPRNDVMLHYNNKIYIKTIPTPVEQEIFMKEHMNQVKYLEDVIRKAESPLLICSYYSPFTWLYEEDWIQELSSAIIDLELEKLITYPIVAWITGHNHLPIEYNRRYFLSDGYAGSVLFVSNPRGKPKKENKDSLYRKDCVLRLAPNMLEGFQIKEEQKEPEWVRRNRLTF